MDMKYLKQGFGISVLKALSLFFYLLKKIETNKKTH